MILLTGCEGDPGLPGINRLGEDLYPPKVEIILPVAGRPLYEQAIVEIQVTDDVGVDHIGFLVNGESADNLFQPLHHLNRYLWNCRTLVDGRHSLQIQAYDSYGKTGVSSPIWLNKTSGDLPTRDTLRYYYVTNNPTTDPVLDWKLPSDSLVHFDGMAVRFTPDRPCRLRAAGVKVKRKAAWDGTQLYLDLYSSRNGMPDSLLNRKVISLRIVEPTEYVDWDLKTYGSPGISLDGEFFLAVVLAEAHSGDTLAVQTDGGLWNNGHGYYRYNEQWQKFSYGRNRSLNPLIYAVVGY